MRVEPLPPPPLGRVELAFEYTFEELQEGLTTPPDGPPKKPPMSAKKALLGWLAFVALATLLFMLLNRTNATRARGMPTYSEVDAGDFVDPIVAALPSMTAAVAVGLFVLSIALAMLRLMSKHERRQKQAALLMMGGLLLMVLTGLVGIQIFKSTSLADRWSVTRTQAMLLSIGPWIAVVIGSLAVFFQMNRSHLRRQWETKPYLRRRRTVVLDAIGEQSTDEMTTTFYRWPYFQRAFETPNCLVLLDENDARHVLPKRVMDPLTLDLARAVISNHVSDTKFMVTPGGFPV